MPKNKVVTRVDITSETVKEAAALAAKREPGPKIWADKKAHYLMIRQRGGAADWIVKTRGRTRVLGDVREHRRGFLSVSAARKKAATLYGQIANGEDPREPAPVQATTWTWADLDREYQAMIAKPRWINRRRKPPSAGTCDDVRLAFARPSYQALQPKLLTELDRPTLDAARDAIVPIRKSDDPEKKTGVHRQREKCVAYFKAAMTWAADNHPDKSGLVEGADRWWERLTAGEPDDEEMAIITARQAERLERKGNLEIQHIGELLARHEDYCGGRTAEEKISPGIRWGLWWVCLTANRRFSTVKLKRSDFLALDEFADDGWGRAMWPPDTMKAKIPFWLPLPPVVRDVALGSIADYTQLVKNHHGDWPSAWVFASTRRHGRDPENDDVSVYPNSLNRHLLRMRAAKALDGLPYFSLHLARSVMTNFLDKHVSPVASSLVLAHTLPQTADEAAPTTRAYYLTSQRMDVKSTAMRAWSGSLVEAFLKAGGTMPEPRETFRKSKLNRTTRDGFIVVDTKSPDLSIGASAVFPTRPAE